MGKITIFGGGKSPFFLGKSPFFWGKSPFFMGKSPFFYGKITIFYGKITIFYGKITIFYGKITIFLWENHLFYGKIHYFYGHFQLQTVSSPEGMGKWGLKMFKPLDLGAILFFGKDIRPKHWKDWRNGWKLNAVALLHIEWKTCSFTKDSSNLLNSGSSMLIGRPR